MKRRLCLPGIVWFFVTACLVAEGDSPAPQEAIPSRSEPVTFTLWQLPNQTHSQMMSYVLRTVHGKVIVVDGGTAGDAPYLTEFLKPLGNTIEAWIITHPHDDHVDALREILKNPGDLKIKALWGSLPDVDWVTKHCDASELLTVKLFAQALAESGHGVEEVSAGQEMEIDGLKLLFLGVKNPEITHNPMNNSSLAFRVSDASKSVLFLGDLGFEGGKKLLAGPFAGKLHADYVQMAHHGQNGVGEAVYKQVNPSYCLWPTPLWLWDNDNGGGKNSGRWHTLEVRAWMDKLPVKAHYVMYEGLHKIE